MEERTGCEEQPITEHGVMSEETPSLEQKKDDQLGEQCGQNKEGITAEV